MYDDETWAIVLAGGDGERVSTLTVDPVHGTRIPKQYFSFFSGRSLLETTLCRARRIVDDAHIVVVVLERHSAFWPRALAAIARENIVVQPANRGTATGVLAPLLRIVGRSPESRVVLFPSDHYVGDEHVLESAVRRALFEVSRNPEHPILLGATPDRPDSQYGWIMPGTPVDGGVAPVLSFIEKPDPERAGDLFDAGALWSTMMMVGDTARLVELFDGATPELRRKLLPCMFGMRADVEKRGTLWRSLPLHDLSRDVLEPLARELRVLRVPPCGWTDLGTPERIAEVRAVRAVRVAAMAT